MAYPFHLQSQPNLDDIRSAVDSGCDLDNACARWLVDVSTDLLEGIKGLLRDTTADAIEAAHAAIAKAEG
jgi:hypothetical protein